MADHAIQKSQNILKRLDEEMIFLNSLMAETNDLVTKMNCVTAQVIFVSSNLKSTWSALDKTHRTWDNPGKKEELL